MSRCDDGSCEGIKGNSNTYSWPNGGCGDISSIIIEPINGGGARVAFLNYAQPPYGGYIIYDRNMRVYAVDITTPFQAGPGNRERWQFNVKSGNPGEIVNINFTSYSGGNRSSYRLQFVEGQFIGVCGLGGETRSSFSNTSTIANRRSANISDTYDPYYSNYQSGMKRVHKCKLYQR
jgi:hypothetical protein